ncbi:GNAT family N-acetyltransferase [Streptomyces sp. NPDC015220]|uniref:GNAT family N-acetyltransferase n=1 Tax=Streptomyces sp. NPDC015220 TaxID=3364947 RepID=UPI0036FBCF3A
MDTSDVTLRPVDEADLPVMERVLRHREDASHFQWFGWRDPARWRRMWEENGLLTDDMGHLMVARGAERLGFVSWRKIQMSLASYYWNLGIALMPEARGQGAGTEAQRQLVRYLFAHTPVARIEADTEADNFAEQRALEKAGFTREGVMRGVIFRDGQWRDHVRYGILRDELG